MENFLIATGDLFSFVWALFEIAWSYHPVYQKVGFFALLSVLAIGGTAYIGWSIAVVIQHILRRKS